MRVSTAWVAVALSLCPLLAQAQPTEAAARAPAPARLQRPEERVELRLRYGLAWRTGGQVDATGPGMTYEGLTPNEPGLQAWGFPLLDGVLGFTGGLSREGFSLVDPDSKATVTGGGLLRAQAGLTARFRLGPARLEPVIGYSLAQIAAFTDTAAPVLRPATRHGLLLGARGLFDLGPVTLEGRLEVPVSLAASDGAGGRLSSQGIWASLAVRVSLFRTGPLLWGAVVDAGYSTDRVDGDALVATQRHVRGGVALALLWRDPDPIPTQGALAVSVRRDDGQAAPSARVTVQSGEGELTPRLDAMGRARLDGLSPGVVTVRVTLDGYEAPPQTAEVAAGAETTVAVVLQRARPTVGSLVVTVVDKQRRAPLAGAVVRAAGLEVTTDPTGVARFEGLAPGAVGIDAASAGYTPVNDAVTVLAGVEARVQLELASAKAREPATVTGFVRSGRSGAPVTARLEIPEARLEARADDKGAFAFSLPGGTYTVTISAKGFVTQSKQVTVKDGDRAIFNVDLQPK